MAIQLAGALSGAAFMISGMALRAWAQDTAGAEPGVHIYWPVAYYAGLEQAQVPNVERLKALLDRTNVAYSFSIVPIRRSVHLYTEDPKGCVVFIRKRLRPDELISGPTFGSDHWFYVRADGPVRSVQDIRTAATLEGASLFVSVEAGYEWISWQFAPTYQALIAMLEGGRVDAATLGPLVADGVLTPPDNLVRLGDKPFAHIEGHLHCKPTDAAKRLVDQVDAIVGPLESPKGQAEN